MGQRSAFSAFQLHQSPGTCAYHTCHDWIPSSAGYTGPAGLDGIVGLVGATGDLLPGHRVPHEVSKLVVAAWPKSRKPQFPVLNLPKYDQ